MDPRMVFMELLCIWFLIITPTTIGADDQDDDHNVKLTLVNSAVKEGAVCLDGSPPAYHIVRGIRDGAYKWIVFLDQGALCYDTKSCLHTSKTVLGSSKLMGPANFTSLLSSNRHLNPYFYKWNRVFVRYCDGSLYTGNRYDGVHKLYYKGAIIFNAVVKELLNKGMNNATNVLLYGCSAGGQAAILNCDKFRSLLPKHTNVKCASEGGYFVHTTDVLGEYNFEKVFIEGCANTHGSVENLPKACTSTMKPKSLCLYPQYVIPHIKTPVFVTNSALDMVQISFVFTPYFKNLPHSWTMCESDFSTCSADQLEIFKGFRLAFLRALPRVGNGTFRGMFITSCNVHCRDIEPEKDWSQEWRKEQNQFVQALGSWTVAGTPVQKIDHSDVPRMCNKPSIK